MRPPTRLARIIFAMILAASAFIAPESRAASRIPPDAVAYWRLDTTKFAGARADPAVLAQRRVLIAGLRAAVASGLIAEPRAAGALEAVLAASEVGARPHTLCLLDLDADRPERGEGMDPNVLRMVLELESAGDHAALLRTLRAILVGDTKGDADATAQRALALPGGVAGVAFRRADWAPWREVQWASTERTFVIGLGAGSLERWFAAQHAEADPNETPVWDSHRGHVAEDRPPGDVVFEAYLGLDRARDGFPWGFMRGRVRRVLETVGLSNARDVMFHARWIEPPPGASHPPLIAADITWRARSERPGVVRGVPISESAWPQRGVSMPPPPGTYAMVLRADWERWVMTALTLYPAASSSEDEPRRAAVMRDWARRNRGTLARLLARAEPWLVVSDVPLPVTPMPGAATFFIELRSGADAIETGNLLRTLIGAHMGRVLIDDGVWSYNVDDRGVLRIPAWGFVGPNEKPILVGGWGPPVVTENRARLGDPLPPQSPPVR